MKHITKPVTEYGRVYIWGAGDFGAQVCAALSRHVDIAGFIDSDPGKQGRIFSQHPVCAPEAIRPGDFVVVAMRARAMEVRDRLRETPDVGYLLVNAITQLYQWMREQGLIDDAGYRALSPIPGFAEKYARRPGQSGKKSILYCYPSSGLIDDCLTHICRETEYDYTFVRVDPRGQPVRDRELCVGHVHDIKYFLAVSGAFDYIHIIGANPSYAAFVEALGAKCGKLIVTVMGSEFYRLAEKHRSAFEKLYSAADVIACNHYVMKADMTAFFGQAVGEKIATARWGSATLDAYLACGDARERSARLRTEMGLDDKLVISIGHSATPEARQVETVTLLAGLDPALKARTALLVNMTYPKDPDLRAKVEGALQKSGFLYRIQDRFLPSPLDVAIYRGVSDLYVDMVTTDSFSLTFQEYMACGAVCIVGDWLPYGLFDDEGCVYYKVHTLEELPGRVAQIAENLDDARRAVRCNRAIIERLSSWRHCVAQWQALYQ